MSYRLNCVISPLNSLHPIRQNQAISSDTVLTNLLSCHVAITFMPRSIVPGMIQSILPLCNFKPAKHFEKATQQTKKCEDTYNFRLWGGCSISLDAKLPIADNVGCCIDHIAVSSRYSVYWVIGQSSATNLAGDESAKAHFSKLQSTEQWGNRLANTVLSWFWALPIYTLWIMRDFV